MIHKKITFSDGTIGYAVHQGNVKTHVSKSNATAVKVEDVAEVPTTPEVTTEPEVVEPAEES
jgi:hypothetical protein